MKHHCKEFWNMVKKVQNYGCPVNVKGDKVMIYSMTSEQMIICHAGERGLHPLRRWLKREGIAA